MLLYGMSMIYGATGSLEVTEVAQRIADGDAIPTILIFGLVFVVAGIGFKLGAVPFHMWVPDVYHGAPTRDVAHRHRAQACVICLHHAHAGRGARRPATDGGVAADAGDSRRGLPGDRQHHGDRAKPT